MTKKKFSKLEIHPVVYEVDSNLDWVLDNNGNRIVIKDWDNADNDGTPYVLSTDHYHVIVDSTTYTPDMYVQELEELSLRFQYRLPQPAKYPQDYEVWVATFLSVLPGQNGADPNNLGYYGMVPMIPMTGNSLDSNGFRNPSTVDGSDFNYQEFIDAAKDIHPSRRVGRLYYYYNDLTPYKIINTFNPIQYYKNTADGYTYQGTRFLNLWQDVNYADVVASFTEIFYELTITHDLYIPFLSDDREYWLQIWGMEGYNNYYNGAYDHFTGAPITEVPGLGWIPDARVQSALIDDIRFAEQVIPGNNMTFLKMFEQYYCDLSEIDVSGSGQTLLSDYIGILRSWEFVIPQEPPYVLPYDKFVLPAFHAALYRTSPLGYASRSIRTAINNVYHQSSQWVGELSPYKPMYHNYENYPISKDEAKFSIDSNNRIIYHPTTIGDEPHEPPSALDDGGGYRYYGNTGNIIWSEWATYINSAPEVDLNSGYIKPIPMQVSPIIPLEQLCNWQGLGMTTCAYFNSTHNDCHNGSAVPPDVPDDAQTRHLIRYAATRKTDQVRWGKELPHKEFINCVKMMRLQQRSDSTWWTRSSPWITYPLHNFSPTITPSPGIIVDTFTAKLGTRYWVEMLYHLFLHGGNYISLFNTSHDIPSLDCLQLVLEEWRYISNNKKIRPCSNTTGKINLDYTIVDPIDAIVDRIILYEAAEDMVISGGKTLTAGGVDAQYIWRLTCPPSKIINIATNGDYYVRLRKRIANYSNSNVILPIDHPEEIVIDLGKTDKPLDLKNGVGAWIVSKHPMKPIYDFVLS